MTADVSATAVDGSTRKVRSEAFDLETLAGAMDTR